jgi:hypothetical protein
MSPASRRDFTSVFMKIKEFIKPHKSLRRGVLVVRRGSKLAENAAHRKNSHLGVETRCGGQARSPQYQKGYL